MAENPNRFHIYPDEPHFVRFYEKISVDGKWDRFKFLPDDGKCQICGSKVETDVCIRRVTRS